MDNTRQRNVEDTHDIGPNRIKDFNNNIIVVVLAELLCIISNKYVIDSFTRILADIINNPFKDLFLLSMALPSSLPLPSLPYLYTFFTLDNNNTSRSYAASTTGNSSNIPITFTYYVFICM